MKLNYLKTIGFFAFFIFYISYPLTAQVGINTISPGAGSMLDIDSPDKGLLVPRVDIQNLNSISPVTGGSTESLLVYNTNATTGKGFYYWNGTQWMPIQDGKKDWEIAGNGNITNGTHFIGTTNDRQIDFKTNNTNRLRIPGNANQLYSMHNGSNIAPFYSWSADTNIGMWRPAEDQLALSAGGVEFIRLSETATNDALVINEDGADVDTRIETDTNLNMFFVDGGTNRVGINTAAPLTELHIAGNGSTVRIDELNDANNVHNIGVDPAPVYVDINGDLKLQPPLVQTFMPINVLDFIPGAGISIQSPTGEGVTTNLYSTTITLSQESLVHLSYQFSVMLTRADGVSPIVDGASRLYRAWISVNGSTNFLALDSGTYTNNPDVASGTYAAGYYYLNGNGYIQLPAGTHTLVLTALGFAGGGGIFDYRMIFGQTAIDNFQVVVHR